MYRMLHSFKWLIFVLAGLLPKVLHAQAVTSIITDLNGFWKSSNTSPNPIKPNKSHNLLSFSYNGTQYSTGVNNELLTSMGENFVVCDFWSLPVASISGSINSNTKAGLGALYDGVANGASNPAPANNIPFYLTDGTKGLNIGTCIANLPVGTMDFFASNIDVNSIGDGIPDILVTQVADPSSGSFDRYEFINNNGTRVGTYKDIVFTSISPVGTWTADFYEASQNPMTLTAGFTQTDRPMRLWAADLSEFGLTASNIGSISKFRINLCGNSDVAFVAYNSLSFRVTTVLPLVVTSFKGSVVNNQPRLHWQLTTSDPNTKLEVQRSEDARSFETINIQSLLPAESLATSYIDSYAGGGDYYYRLKWVDEKGRSHYSGIVHINIPAPSNIKLLRPDRHRILAEHPTALNAKLFLYHTSGRKILEQSVEPTARHTSLSTRYLAPGVYVVVFSWDNKKLSKKIVVQQ